MTALALAPYESWSFRVAWPSHPDDPAPVWVDETARVDGTITVTEGRADYNSTIRVSQLSVALRNHDQRFTPGNRLSPLWPNVKPARRCQLVDRVGSEEITIFDGFIALPEIVEWKKSDTTAPREQLFNLTAVDRMGRLDRARPFVSTLGAAVTGGATNQLVHYAPLNDQEAPARLRNGGALAVERGVLNAFGQTVPAMDELVQLGQGGSPRGDDITGTLFTPQVGGSGDEFTGHYGYLEAQLPTPLVLATGEVLTLAIWVSVTQTTAEDMGLAHPAVNLLGATISTSARIDYYTPTTGERERRWRFLLTTADGWGSGGAIDGPSVQFDRFTFLAARLQLAAAQELWVDGSVTSGSNSGTPPASATFTRLRVGQAFAGTISHVQVYKSDAAGDYSATIHADQLTVGRHGLARQRVDERIATIAGYAGVPAADLHLDRASAIMPVARLAGRRPGDLLRDAAAADNGQILAHGDGHLTFLTRGRRYNPPLAATVQLTWLEEVAWRTDPPVNVADVGTTAGFEGHAVDPASVHEFGEYAPDLPTLDTAVDLDAANLAAHTVRYGQEPRQRPSRLVCQLRGGTSDLIRGTVLRREIGDRVHLAGLPANAPEGADMFHLEGMQHQVSSFGHRVTWYTGPVVGSIPGTPDPLPKVGAAKVRHNTTITY